MRVTILMVVVRGGIGVCGCRSLFVLVVGEVFPWPGLAGLSVPRGGFGLEQCESFAACEFEWRAWRIEPILLHHG